MSTAEQAARKPRGPAAVTDANLARQMEALQGQLKVVQVELSAINTRLEHKNQRKTVQSGVGNGVVLAFFVIILLSPLWMFFLAVIWGVISMIIGGG